MAQASRRIEFTGPALVRLLASLTQGLVENDVPASRQAFAERLSRWVGWTDAIALSAALGTADSPAPGVTAAAPAPAGSHSVEDHDAQRVRATLTKSLADDSAVWTSAPGSRASGTALRLQQRQHPQALPAATGGSSTDFAAYRWRYLSHQQAMETAIAPLRERLRKALSARAPALARLAAVDAAMERALGAQARSLLASVPSLLERRFTQQRDAAVAAVAADTDGWLQQFQHDMHSVLLAELDLRLLPVEALLAALRQPLPAAQAAARLA